MDEFQQSGGQPLPQDPTKPVNPFAPKPTGPVLPDRQMAAYGGIMGMDGRRQYGLGSFLKKTVRKIIPNEVAEIAVKAAPFVAPFNPLAAGLMSGIGSFDQTGRIGSSIKSGLMNYGLGQGARFLGGAGFQTGINPMTGSGVQGADFFSKPTGTETGLGKFFSKSKAPVDVGAVTSDAGFTNTANQNVLKSLEGTSDYFPNLGGEIAKEQSKNLFGKAFTELPGLVKKNLQAAGLGNNLVTGLLVGGLGAGALMGGMTEEEQVEMNRGEGMDVEAIRQEVLTAMKDPTGDALKAIRVKYPFLGRRDTKDFAMGGRIGFDGGGGFSENDLLLLQKYKFNPKEVATYLDGGKELLKSLRSSESYVVKAEGGRIGRAEGGLMDLGGMEKDYRAEGGFVPIGKAEKADDVPARLSVNEFVFTADAVRNAGGGDIDRGAEVMENMMKHLEQGGQVSDESQGIQSLRAGGRAGFANGLRVDTDKVIEDIKKFSIPGLIGRGVKAGVDKISDIDLETIIKVVAKAAPGGMVVQKVTEFLVDRYGMSPDEAQMRIVNKLGTDANEGFKNPSATSDEGYRMVGIESSAEDTSDIPRINRLRNLLGTAPSIEMPRPEKRFPDDNKYYPDGPGKFPERKPFVPGEPVEFERGPFRPGDGRDFELLKKMFDTSERLSEVVG
jgi:hypothetical protein